MLARFVFAQSARTTHPAGELIQVWLRAWPDERYPQLRENLQRLVNSIDGARIAFPSPPFPAMISSPQLSESAALSLGWAPVSRFSAAFPFNGEDFALFLQQVPGAMVFLGVADTAAGMDGIPHAPDFAADERAIAVGVRGMAGLLTDRLRTLTAVGP